MPASPVRPSTHPFGRRRLLGAVGLIIGAGAAVSACSSGSGGAGPVEARPFDPSVPYLEFGAESGAPVVDLYEDYLCPHCKDFHDAQAEDLQRLAAEKAITLRVHPRPLLDQASAPPGYSGRAASVAIAAFEQSPEVYFEVSDELFDEQPGKEGLTDEQLVQLAVDAGAEKDRVAAALADGTYLDWLASTVEAEAASKDIGTPTVYIDGVLWEGSPTAKGSLAEDLEG